MTVKNNPNRFAYIGCLIHSLDRALDELTSVMYNNEVCDILTEEEVDMLDRYHDNLMDIYGRVQARIKEFGIKGEGRIDCI